MKGIALTVVMVALFAAALAAVEEADVVVVGAGAAGLSAAIAATRDNPNTKVVVLEKGAKYGGTSIRSGGRLWVPNNEDLDALGITDAKLDALKYMARMAHPDVFSADKEYLGLGQRHYELLEAYYDNGRDATSWMRTNNCLSWEAEKINFMFRKHDPLNLTGQLEPDYWPLIPENKVGRGRTIAPFKFNPKDPRHGHSVASGSSLGGPDLMNWLHYGCSQRNVTFHYNVAVTDLILLNNTDGSQYVDSVVYVDAKSGAQKQIKAKKGVVFATGGFSKDKAKMTKFLTGPITGGGCGVNTNTGDFIDIALKHGFLLDNMQRAWFIENIYEQWLKDPRSEHGLIPSYLLFQAYWLQGDSMFQVNSRGKRVCNEKSPYNERTQSHFYYDDSVHDYTNRYEINIFDHHTLKYFWGPPGQILPDVLSYKDIKIGPAKDMPTLVQMIKQRLATLANTTGNFQLQADFESNIQDTLANFNKFATLGVDPEFNRGLSLTDVKWHSFCLNVHGVDILGIHDCISANVDEKGKRYPNPTMRPLAPPYYAVIMSSGLQDTNGGPAINAQAQVLDLSEKPVGKLYGAGNCIGAPAGNAYWGAGSTLGPAVVFGHIAGRNAAK